MGKLLDAIKEATPEDLAEGLAPFAPFGVKSFTDLVTKFKELLAFKVATLKEAEDATKAVTLAEARKTSFSKLTKAGLKLENENDPRLTAYLSLSEADQPNYVKALLNKPMSAGNGGVGAITEADEAKETLSEAEKKDLVGDMVSAPAKG